MLGLLGVVVVAVAVAADWHSVGSGSCWPWPIHRVGEGGACGFIVWTVGNKMPSLTAVETSSGITLIGSDLASRVLGRPHVVLGFVLWSWAL